MNKYSGKERTLLLFVLAVLFLISLTGCSNSKSGKITLTLAHEGTAQVYPIYRTAIAEFEKEHPNIEIKEIFIESQYYPKLMTMIAGGMAPDVMWMGRGFGEFTYRDTLLDLEPLIAQDKTFDLTQYNQRVLRWYRYKGKLYGLPMGADVAIMAYNKDMFDKEGIPYPSESWTNEDMLAAAKRLTKDLDGDERIDQYGVAMERDNIPNLGAFGASVLSGGTDPVCTLNKSGAVDALDYFVSLVNKEKVHPPTVGGTVGGMDGGGQGFVMGKVAMYYTYSWSIDSMSKQIKGFDWDLALFPKQKQRVHWASSQGFTIYKGTKHPKESYLLMKYLVGKDFQKAMSTYTIPTIDVVANEMVKKHTGTPEHFGMLLTALKYAVSDPRVPFITEIVDIE